MWRLVFVVGAALFGYGCSRKNSEESNPRQDPPAVPASNSGHFETPVIPSDFASRFTRPAPSSAVTPVTPRLDCSRFQQAIVGTRIRPQTELEKLRREVMPRVVPHINEIQNNHFSGVQNDSALTIALGGLQGRDIYLKDGIAGVFDTRSDWENLSTALSYLTALETFRPNADPHSSVSEIYRAWRGNTLLLEFKGFMFTDAEVPDNLRGITPMARTSNNLQFRIITAAEEGNHNQFPILNNCHVTGDDFTSVYIP